MRSCVLCLRLLAATLFALLLVAGKRELPGCAPAPPLNKKVEIANESAIILWDAKSKTQHFIRRANFKTDADDFGFLVPTPTEPELGEVDDKAFDYLAEVTAPRVVDQKRPSGSPGCGCGGAAPLSKNAAPGGITVLGKARVAGQDVVKLKVDEAEALSPWLKKHGYPYSDQLTKWVAPYVKAGWVITAFKIANADGKKEGPDRVGSKAVRMTFTTDRPFFPYREPPEDKSARIPSRLLRVFFISDVRMTGILRGETWPGDQVWSNPLKDQQRDQLLTHLKLRSRPGLTKYWLTEFEDDSSPRPGSADVYFSRDKDQSTIERPPHIQYVSENVPNCVMCYALVVCLFAPSLRRRLRSNARQ